mmetsp:Transcript_1126/g.2400  ORF Transcript_1126/g.2400 Transcript_1126/m.2400 type:complete len:517 (+) Transcript_1126:242-1792(+)
MTTATALKMRLNHRSLTTILVTSMLRWSLLPSSVMAVPYSTKSSISRSTDSQSHSDSYSYSYSYRTVQVQVIHRHGDRTPITPLKNEEFWKNELVPEDLLERVAVGTEVLREHGETESTNNGKNELEIHAAAGKGPFGKLTKLGLLGMIQVGSSLKEELEESTYWAKSTNAANTIACTSIGNGRDNNDGLSSQGRRLLEQQESRRIKLSPRDIKVYSTDFPRTIQSVQGLLVGFFPEEDETNTISIDCRNTTCWMIPDPQPRQTHEQKVLERKLAQRPHILEQETLLRPLAVRCTNALLPLLGDGAFGVSFGVDESDPETVQKMSKAGLSPPVLSWIQLCEITKCLQTRDLLPDSITEDDREALASHTAWKWFQSLRTPRLAYIAMRGFTQTIVRALQERHREPPLIVYSGHDSSLIGLMCALHLEQPSVWPEYGAVLKLELLEKRKEMESGSDNRSMRLGSEDHEDNTVEHVLRFFLNGELLRSVWNDIPREEITLQEFVHLISTVGKDATAETV